MANVTNKVSTQTPAILDAAKCAKPPYPAISRKLREEGRVELSVKLMPDGSIAETKLLKSSGFARLDTAAQAAAVAGCRGKPANIDGVAQASWLALKIEFKLED